MANTQGAFMNVSNNIISVPAPEFPFKDGVGTTLFEKMQKIPSKTAQIDALTGEVDTYQSYLQRCVRTAIVMRKKGIRQNDGVVVCSDHHLNTSVPMIASYFLGAKLSNTDPQFTLKDTVHLLGQVLPKMVFVNLGSVKLIENATKQINISPEIVVFGTTEKHTPFSQFLAESLEELEFQPVTVRNLKETAVVYFSSGSTGLPKGICLSHLALLSVCRNLKKPLNFVILSTSPAYWTTYTTLFLTAIMSNSCRLILPVFDIVTFWKTVEQYKVNFLLISRAQIALSLEHNDLNDHDLSSIKVVILGGVTIPEQQLVKFRSYITNGSVFCVYGLTEFACGGLGFDSSNQDHVRLAIQNPKSCGLPMSGFTYKVVDEETGKALGPNQFGELRIRTEYQMNGYHNMDASDQWDSDGFLKTGDIVCYDEDYCFYVTDRIKEIFKYRGWQISPFKIELVLLSHPAVENAIAIGVPHLVDYERPAALVVLRQNYVGKVSECEIVDYVDNNVFDSHRLRGGIIFVKKLLVTSNGKFQRRYMRELVLSNRIQELQ
ncbi:hypothetical protein FQA39_LY11041 [Lamprigera yunnana]|nr:hypothetical protein FQA39_LY11041 [Lamprigera yunnana]